MISKLRTWLTTDGPGVSGYPKRDIATNRRLAWVFKWSGVAIFVLAMYSAWNNYSHQALMLIVAAAAIYVLSVAGRVQALEWEIELLRSEREE